MNNETIAKNPELEEESITELLKRLGADSASLVHQEVALAKQEFSEKMQALLNGVIMISVGAVIGIVAFVTLWASFIIWLIDNYLSPAIATVITGGGLSLIGAIIVYSGIKLFQKTTYETIKTVEAHEGGTRNG